MKDAGLVAQDSSVHDLEEGTNEHEQLKRNMGARHINMIAIAGMIVSLQLDLPSPSRLADLHQGNGFILELRKDNCQSWSGWCTLGIYLDGIHHSWSLVHDWRNYSFHAGYWWLRSPCHSFHGTSAWCRYGLELLVHDGYFRSG